MQLKILQADAILSNIETIRANGELFQEKNFHLRTKALDDIECQIIERIDTLIENKKTEPRLLELKTEAENLRRRLENINIGMFRKLRLKIASGFFRGNGLKELLKEYLGGQIPLYNPQEVVGYDELDLLVNGILTHHDLPAETREREPEMVYYQKTPARIVLELIDRADFKPSDVFCDLGSGLGQVVMLTHLLSGILSKGVEFEPAFCDYARDIATELKLREVEFINTDARLADYSSATVFFMYTPFDGGLFQEVLKKLSAEAGKRIIKLFTYGPCTAVVAQQSWLIKGTEIQYGPSAFGDFISI